MPFQCRWQVVITLARRLFPAFSFDRVVGKGVLDIGGGRHIRSLRLCLRLPRLTERGYRIEQDQTINRRSIGDISQIRRDTKDPEGNNVSRVSRNTIPLVYSKFGERP